MIYIIYLLVFLILIFIIYIGGKAVNRGIKAKQTNSNQNKNDFKLKFKSNNPSHDLIYEIKKLKKLYENGTLTEEEFKKAKNKILNS